MVDSARRKQVGAVAGAVGALCLVVVVGLGVPTRSSGDEPPPPAPTTTGKAPPRAPAPERTPSPAPEPAPPATPAPASPSTPADALAPMHAAPALGLEVGDGARVDVDPFTGFATLLETDARLPLGLGLRRARTLSDAPGLFGRGWRSEVDASLHALEGERFALRRVDGVVLYTKVNDDLWVSALGEVEWLVRTPEGFEVRDPAGRLHRFDAQGRVVEVLPGFRIERDERAVRLVGGVATLTLALDDHGRVARATGPGVDLTYEYDAEGELVAVTGTRARRYAHEDGLVREVHGARGLELRLTHDDAGRLARLDAPALAPAWAQVYAFDRGRAEVTTPRGAWRYAATDDGWRVETPGGVEHVRLDERGRVVGVRRGDGPERRVERDAQGRVISSAPALPALPGEVTTPAGRRWSFTRDEAGRTTAVEGPGGRLEVARDAAGRRRRVRDGAGRELHLVRDARGQVEELAAGDEAIPFAFDDAGRLVRAGAGADQVAHTWTRDGRLAAAATADARLVYTHEPGVERVTTPWGELARARDERGRVSRLETPAGTFTFTHDARGRRMTTSAPNGVTTTTTRDAHGRALTLAAGEALSLEHTRDERGAVVSRARDGVTTTFGHDAAGRLTSAGARTWSLDADGERTAQDGAAWEHDTRGRLVRAGDVRLEHDASGRLVRRAGPAGETRYAWDAFGRLSAVTRAPRGGTASTVSYAYDGLGRVVARTSAAGTTRYVHERGQRLAELGPGDRVRLWLHGPGLDEPLAYRDVIDGQARPWVFLHADELGTVLAYTGEDGAPVARAELDPFGVVLSAPGGDHPVLFAGRPVDPETGLVDLRARFYAPDLGRFLAPDPAGLVGGPAPYVYADGRPLELRDPLGLWPWSSDAGEDAASPAEPSTATTACHALTAWLTNTAISATRWTAEQLDAGRAAVRDARLSMIRAGFVDHAGVDRPHGSTSTFVNFTRDVGLGTSRDALEVLEGALGLAHDLVAIDADGRGALDAAHAGAREAWNGYRQAFERAQQRYMRMVDTLTEAGHSPADAFAITAGIAVGENVTPAVVAWELKTGLDFDALVDRSHARRLSKLELAVRGAELGADLVGAGLSRRARKAADAAADVQRARRTAGRTDDLARRGRPARGADAPTPPPRRAPQDGLAQALDPDTPRGVTATSPTSAALEPGPSRAITGSDTDVTSALNEAPRHAPELPERTRSLAGDDLDHVARDHAANSSRPRAPPTPRYEDGKLKPPEHPSAPLEPTPADVERWQRLGAEGGQPALISEARAARLYEQTPMVHEVVLGEEAVLRRLGMVSAGDKQKRVDGLAVLDDGRYVPFEVKNQKEIKLGGKDNAAFGKFETIAREVAPSDMERISHFEVVAHSDSKLPKNHRVDADGWVQVCTAGLEGEEWSYAEYGGKRVRVVRAPLGRISID